MLTVIIKHLARAYGRYNIVSGELKNLAWDIGPMLSTQIEIWGSYQIS